MFIIKYKLIDKSVLQNKFKLLDKSFYNKNNVLNRIVL